MSFITDISQILKGVRAIPELRAEVAANEKRAVERQAEIRQLFAIVIDGHFEQTALFERLLRLFTPGQAAVIELELVNSTGETTTLRTGDLMQLPRNSTVTGTIKVYDSADPATRNETTLDGAPSIVLTPGPNDPNIEMTVDGLNITLKSNAKAGVALVTVDGDAKIGEGVVPLSFSADINVPAGEAVVGEVVFREPVANA